MEVRETIEWRRWGSKIKHGIYRDFRYATRLAGVITSPWDLKYTASADGHAEPFHTTTIGNGIRIYFGDSGQELTQGVHTYVFTYSTSRPLSFLKDHDEL